jgi:hypothetical protein
MQFIRPKTNKKNVSWEISQRTLDILALYSKYSSYSEGEIVDMFMENLTQDSRFIQWTKKQRNRKKIDNLLEDTEVVESSLGEADDETDETDRQD